MMVGINCFVLTVRRHMPIFLQIFRYEPKNPRNWFIQINCHFEQMGLQGLASLQHGQVIINGSTKFLDESNGHKYTLNDIQNGKAPEISSNDNVAVWVGVNPGSATITDLKVNSTPVPLGQLPEVPYAAALPLAGGIVLVGGIIWHRRRNRA